MNIIGHKYIFLTFSAILVLASIAAILVWGLRLGIDFTGGSLLEIEFSRERPANGEARSSERPDTAKVHEALEPLGLENVAIQPAGERGMILRFKHIDEETHQQVLKALEAGRLERVSPSAGSEKLEGVIAEKRFDTIGPTIGNELKRKSFMALIMASFGIVLYLAWAFRNVSKPVSSWKYGLVAVAVAFLHDVPIPLGFFVVLGHFKGVEIDTLFITALLTILGFSVHDTIVVFDRIRENLRKLKIAEAYDITVNRSVNETMARSINTSFTVLLVLVSIFFFGGETTRYFALALIIGIVFGTYSSIFVASPLLVIWNGLTKKK